MWSVEPFNFSLALPLPQLPLCYKLLMHCVFYYHFWRLQLPQNAVSVPSTTLFLSLSFCPHVPNILVTALWNVPFGNPEKWSQPAQSWSPTRGFWHKDWYMLMFANSIVITVLESFLFPITEEACVCTSQQNISAYWNVAKVVRSLSGRIATRDFNDRVYVTIQKAFHNAGRILRMYFFGNPLTLFVVFSSISNITLARVCPVVVFTRGSVLTRVWFALVYV